MADRWQWLKHAFAIEDPGPAEPVSPEQREIIDRLAQQIARRRLSLPGLVALEMFKPIHYVGAQLFGRTLVRPYLWMLARNETVAKYDEVLEFLEKRGSFDYLLQRVEHFESQYEKRGRHDREAGESGEKAARDVQQLTGQPEAPNQDPSSGS